MVPPVGGEKATQDPSTPFAGVVVAGGASRRFGSDKAFALLDGVTLVERAHRTLALLTSDVLLADAGRALLAGVESAPDGPGQGPAAAVLGAARLRPGRALLVLACDLPRVPAELLRRIAAAAGDWVVPRHEGGIEPLVSLYRPRALEALGVQVARGDLALHHLAQAILDIRYLDAESFADLGDARSLFANVNTPDDLRGLSRGTPPSLG
jgi:molybdopterin-guanine dinucleotide biosynthesis protein A